MSSVSQLQFNERERDLVRRALSGVSQTSVFATRRLQLPDSVSIQSEERSSQETIRKDKPDKWGNSTRIVKTRRRGTSRSHGNSEKSGASILESALAALENSKLKSPSKASEEEETVNSSLITESRPLIEQNAAVLDGRKQPHSAVNLSENPPPKERRRKPSIVSFDLAHESSDKQEKGSASAAIASSQNEWSSVDFETEQQHIIAEAQANSIVNRYVECCAAHSVRPLPSLCGVCHGISRCIADHRRRVHEAEEAAEDAEEMVAQMVKEEKAKLKGTVVAKRWKKAARRASIEAGPLLSSSSLDEGEEAAKGKRAKVLSIAEMAYQARLEEAARKRVEARLREELSAKDPSKRKLIRAGLHVMAPNVKSGLQIVLRNSQIGPLHAAALADCLLMSFKEGVDVISFRADGAFFGRRGFRTLAEVVVLQKRMRLLNIANTGLSTEDARLVGALLAGKPTLNHVDISDNSFGDKGIAIIANILAEGVEGSGKTGQVFSRVDTITNEVRSLRALQPNKGKGKQKKLKATIADSPSDVTVAAGLLVDEDEEAVEAKFEIWKLGSPTGEGEGRGAGGSDGAKVKAIEALPGEVNPPIKCSFRSLNIARVGVGTTFAGCRALCVFLTCAQSLKHLNLSWNKIGKDAAAYLAKSLGRHATLESLDLSWNGIDDEAALEISLAIEYCHSLNEVNLSHNRIGARGAMVLCGSASQREECPPMNKLQLDGNPIGRVGGRSAIFALKTVDVVTLKGCNISSKTLEEMDEGPTSIFDPSRPEGVYTLDLSDPYDRAVARELMVAARRDKRGEWTNESINGSSFRLPLYAAFQLPRTGVLRLAFRQTSESASSSATLPLESCHFERILSMLDSVEWECQASTAILSVVCDSFTYSTSQLTSFVPALLELQGAEKVDYLCKLVAKVSDRRNLPSFIFHLYGSTGLSIPSLEKVAAAARISPPADLLRKKEKTSRTSPKEAGSGSSVRPPVSPGRLISSRVKAQQAAAAQSSSSSEYLSVVSNTHRPHQLRSSLTGVDSTDEKKEVRKVDREREQSANDSSGDASGDMSMSTELHSVMEEVQDDNSVGWSLENPTGRYVLDLSSDADRDTLRAMMRLARDEIVSSQKNRKRTAAWSGYLLCTCKYCSIGDTSQLGGSLPQFRNVTLNQQFLVIDFSWVGLKKEQVIAANSANSDFSPLSENAFMVPQTGVLSFDYVETLHKNEGKQALSFFDFEEMVRSLQRMGRGQTADEERVAYIKSTATAQCFLSSQVVRLAFEGLTTWKGRETVAVTLFRRVVDPSNFTYEIASKEGEFAEKSGYRAFVSSVQKRLGCLHLFSPRRPDGFYSLDLSVRDERCQARMLAALGAYDTSVNWVDATLDSSPIALTSQWTTEGIPRSVVGQLELSFETSSTFELQLDSPRTKAKKRLGAMRGVAMGLAAFGKKAAEKPAPDDGSSSGSLTPHSNSGLSEEEGSTGVREVEISPKHMQALTKRRQEFDEFFKSVMARQTMAAASEKGRKKRQENNVDSIAEQQGSTVKTGTKRSRKDEDKPDRITSTRAKYGSQSPKGKKSGKGMLFKASAFLLREAIAKQTKEGKVVRATLASLEAESKRAENVVASAPPLQLN